ncbi:glycerophosphodiester phosphodiesterase [Altererythrobacter sp. SALINAS58]|uniref:glycerophosphodiester phosphodiesterase n=1 Tax=Alteripontixanthobacter muriae TaxID=2705546 RepID=UPI00157648B3|nr:glycerophosphodiester phosphodiesterase [Alteripontixanthobacter muriae]NTZ43629.1 glycerophosphodiester phosphodiesterase [Alteripontixanthobacter muriae]
MKSGIALFTAVLAGFAAPLVAAPGSAPLVIAHRGDSANLPEHTLAAYALAIAKGADFIEPDLVPTRDGHLVARHENEIGGTTNVADHAEFADRRTSKIIDGQRVEGWFTEDFTLAELKRLRTRERLPELRPGNSLFDGEEPIPTLEEILALVEQAGRPVGLYIETKHPSYFRSIGLPVEERLLQILASAGLDDEDAPVFLQSFEVGNLQRLRPQTDLRLVQLASAEGGPADRTDLRYADMLTPDGLAEVATYADGVGVEKNLVIPRDAEGRLLAPTTLVDDAHHAGLVIHAWTFRPENAFLPADYRSEGFPGARGRACEEIRTFLVTGLDGVFSDSVEDAVSARANRC